mgnify:CR=1 FL=1
MSDRVEDHIEQTEIVEVENAKALLEAHKRRKRPFWQKIVRFSFRAFVLMLVLLLLLRFVVSFPVVQNKIVGWTTDYISNRVHAEVNIDYVNFSLFDNLLIQNCLVKDLDGDTILFSKELKAELSLFSLWNKKITIDQLSLKHTQVNIISPKSGRHSNIQFILDEFFPASQPGDPTPEKPIAWDLNIKSFHVEDLTYYTNNAYSKLLTNYHIGSGTIDLEQVDLAKKEIKIDRAVFSNISADYVIDSVRAAYIPNASDSIDYTAYNIKKDSINALFPPKPWLVQANQFKLINSSFHFIDRNVNYGLKTEDFDYANMDYQNINIDIEGLKFYDNEFTSKLNLSLTEAKGFILKELSGDLVINDTLAMLTQMRLITPLSELKDTLAFEYRRASDWSRFNDKIKMNAVFDESEIAVKDILMVAPVLKRNPFFKSNEEEIIKISGRIYDKVNRLKAQNLKILIGRSTRIEGDFKSREITNVNEATLNFNLSRLNTNMRNVQLLFKGVKIPAQMMRLGNLSFSGRMDGFLLDFVTKGKLRTDLGRAESNMKFNFKPGREYGSYSGSFGLQTFQLGKWLDNKDFGAITFNTKIIGQGYSVDEIKAELNGQVKSISFRDYTYKDIQIDGISKPYVFDGELAINDENIDLRFTGEVDFNDTLPRFDLQTKINYANLKPLNLLDLDYKLKGDVQVNFTGLDPNKIDGYAALRDFTLSDDSTDYQLDSLRVTSGIDLNKARFYGVQSDLVEGRLVSNFDFIKVQNILLNYVAVQFPRFTKAFSLKEAITGDSLFVYRPEDPTKNEYYQFHFNIKETRNWLNLVSSDVKEVKNTFVKSRFDSQHASNKEGVQVGRLKFDLDFPLLEFGAIKIGKTSISLRSLGDSCTVTANVNDTYINDSLDIPAIYIDNHLYGDLFKFEVKGNRIGNIFKGLNLKGQIEALENLFEVRIDTSDITIYNRKWSIASGNKLSIYDNRLVPENVVLSNDIQNERISLDSYGRKGLKLNLTNIALDWLEEFVDMSGYKVAGRLDALVKIEDLFNTTNFKAKTSIDSLKLNDIHLGNAEADINFDNLNAPINIDAVIKGENNSKVGFIGTYHAPNLEQNNKEDHYFNFKVETRDYPLDVVEYFIGDFISQTEGTFDAGIFISGTPSDPKLTGNVHLNKVGIMVDYLQTFYRINKATIKITNEAFIIKGRTVRDIFAGVSEGCIVKDKDNNAAFLEGSVYHDKLKDFIFDITLNSDKFVLLNTEKNDNELLYGTAIAKTTLRVTGPLEKPDVNISARSLKGTNFVLPISYSSSASEVKFIEFTNNQADSTKKKPKYLAPQGLNLEMDLDITPSAKVRLVIDEQAGDEIQGQGNGNLQIAVTRTGDFKMSGTYTIEEGQYLFTYKNILNKPFEVRKGGTIVWTGDPLDATINLNAYYRNLKVAPYNLILEYLSTDNEIVAAKKSTKVDLKMSLQGALFKPDISFDLEFPNVDNSVKSYVESKLKLIRDDENELNRQIFALIILREFLPSNATAGINVFDTGFNTLSEMLSNQLSLYVSDLLSEIVGTDGVISSINVDVSYRRAEFEDISNIRNSFSNEVNVGLTNGLYNDRVIISGNVNYEDNYGQYTTDFEVEWMITKDGRWRVRAYNRGEIVVEDYRNKTGIGVSYRQDFNSMRELLRNILSKKKQ